MFAVFDSFLLEDDRLIKLFGVGLAVAVVLDATLVRSAGQFQYQAGTAPVAMAGPLAHRFNAAL